MKRSFVHILRVVEVCGAGHEEVRGPLVRPTGLGVLARRLRGERHVALERPEGAVDGHLEVLVVGGAPGRVAALEAHPPADEFATREPPTSTVTASAAVTSSAAVTATAKGAVEDSTAGGPQGT